MLGAEAWHKTHQFGGFFVDVSCVVKAWNFSLSGSLPKILPLQFIGLAGLSEIDAGLLLLTLSAPMLVVPILASVLAHFISAGILSGVGFMIAVIGLDWLSLYKVGEPKFGLVGPMLLIGIGASRLWGLMGDLSVSVVPKERAAMGICNTVRVAGEGIAMVSVAAMLASQLYINSPMLFRL